MPSKPYGILCPIIRASELLEPRWTITILCALWSGATKFNELRREIGNISPALLSKRLKEMEEAGLVERIDDKATGSVDYLRTKSAIALEPALNGLAYWAQQHIEAEDIACDFTARNLMWDLRGRIDVDNLPNRRVVLQFHFSEDLEYDTYWALVQAGGPVEICTVIPGYDVDLFIETNTISLAGILLGRTTIARETELGELFLSGDAVIGRTMDRWLMVSEYAQVDGIRTLPDNRILNDPTRNLPPKLRAAG